jgi:hypothetical protein
VRLALSSVVVAALALAATGSASSRGPASVTLAVPSWLKVADARRIDSFGGARPIHTYYLWYPHKVAVIFEFRRVVICGVCSAPSNASLPRGRLVRVTYDRESHRAENGIQFCEGGANLPRRAVCLNR